MADALRWTVEMKTYAKKPNTYSQKMPPIAVFAFKSALEDSLSEFSLVVYEGTKPLWEFSRSSDLTGRVLKTTFLG